jgi:cell division inhibitor SulA
MKAVFYQQLVANNPMLRDNVRLGTSETCSNGGSTVMPYPQGVASSFSVLDAFLPWRGWPFGAMTEIMTNHPGCGELSLLLPAMARLTQEKRPILCIGAPHELFAPALIQAGIDPAWVTQINASSSTRNTKENLWAAEQALKTGLPGMVLLWSPASPNSSSNCTAETLRRLHLATIGRETMLIHFRGASSMSQPSPAWLRFGYAADDTHIRLQVLKCRGRELTRPLITLDRAAVQARLFKQLAAEKHLDFVIQHGIPVLQDDAFTQYETGVDNLAITSNKIESVIAPKRPVH